MLDYDYEKEFQSLEKICNENELDFELFTAKFPIIASIKPNDEVRNQMMIDVGDSRKVFRNGEIKFIFADELTMKIINDYVIEDSLLNKLKNQFKKMHYLYLQMYFKEKTKID